MSTFLLLGLVGALFLTRGEAGAATRITLPAWFVIVLATEFLWHRSRTGLTAITMAPAAHVATLALLPGGWGIVLNTLGALGGGLFRSPQRPRVGITYAVAVGLASAGAWSVLAVLGAGLAAPGSGATHGIPTLAQLALLGLGGAVYHVLNQGLISWGTARPRRRSAWRNWRETFGYRTELVTTLGLVLVSLIAVVGYQVLGFRGVLLCVMPLLFIRDGSRRYIELEVAQEKLIETERLAAKGEMAAEIGHELNNYLTAISGRAQLLGLNGRLREDPSWSGDMERIRELSVNMSGLARGLMDFSHREAKRKRFEVLELVQRTVDLVRPQARYRDMAFEIQGDARGSGVEMDPGQIQQVLLTLFGRVARGGTAGRPDAVEIRTLGEEKGRAVRIEILSRRAAAAGDLVGETVVGDADPELGTVRRILERHRGRFEMIQDDETGESYRLTLPAA